MHSVGDIYNNLGRNKRIQIRILSKVEGGGVRGDYPLSRQKKHGRPWTITDRLSYNSFLLFKISLITQKQTQIYSISCTVFLLFFLFNSEALLNITYITKTFYNSNFKDTKIVQNCTFEARPKTAITDIASG